MIVVMNKLVEKSVMAIIAALCVWEVIILAEAFARVIITVWRNYV